MKNINRNKLLVIVAFLILVISLVIAINFNIKLQKTFAQSQSELIEEKLLNIGRVSSMIYYELGYDQYKEKYIGKEFYFLDSCLNNLSRIRFTREISNEEFKAIHNDIVKILSSKHINYYSNRIENVHKNLDFNEGNLNDSLEYNQSFERHIIEDLEYGFISLWHLISSSHCGFSSIYKAKMHVDNFGTSIYITQEPKKFNLVGTVLRNIKINSKDIYSFSDYNSTISSVIWEIRLPNQFDTTLNLSFEYSRLRPYTFEAYDGDSAINFNLKAQ